MDRFGADPSSTESGGWIPRVLGIVQWSFYIHLGLSFLVQGPHGFL